MKILLILVTLGLCWKLYEARYDLTTTPPPPYAITTANIYEDILDDWDNPPAEFNRPVKLSVPDYVYWSALTKFVAPGAKHQPTHAARFCPCKKPYDKRSLVSRARRGSDFSERIGREGLRREWRRMSESARQQFKKHVNNLAVKRTGEEKSRLHIFADWHRVRESPAAHGGPAFLPWHREFLFRFENALRDDGYYGALPYWDSGLDYYLPNPRESAIFTKEELGELDDLGAPFHKVKAETFCAKRLGPTIKRNGTSPDDHLLHRERVDNLPKKGKFVDFGRDLEYWHGGVHGWVGGHMRKLYCSGYEPLFYLHHCYVDYLWEKFRQKQPVNKRARDYPKNNVIDKLENIKRRRKHYGNATMFPFDNKLVIDGMASQYTDVFYSYDDVPETCKNDRTCNAPNDGNLLWCYKRKCRAKIRMGGRCLSKLGDNQCYCPKKKKKNPKCLKNKCWCK